MVDCHSDEARLQLMHALIDEHLADSDAMDYEMDRVDGEWVLADYVAKEHPE